MSIAEMKSATKSNVDVSWRPDPDAESVIGFVGVEYQEKSISVSDIDWNESANNCARMLNPLNEEKIEDYATCMKAGDTFPAVVVESTPTGFVILGGNQRLNAVKRIGCSNADAYVVRGLTTSQRECLIRSLNARHGWGTGKEERIEHAVYLVKALGVSTQDAARLMVVCPSTIVKRLRVDSTRASLAKIGIDAAKLAASHIDAINRVPDEDMQAEVARIAINKGASAESVKGVTDACSQLKNRAAMAAKIKEWSKDLAPVKAGVKKLATPRRDKFLRLLATMNDFLERGNAGTGFSDLDELQCTSLDSDRVKMLSAKILIRLKTIAGV
jgi:hypothetical protein